MRERVLDGAASLRLGYALEGEPDMGPVISRNHRDRIHSYIEDGVREGAAREFRYRAGISMLGVNIGVVVPKAFFPFGGTRGSFYGDLKAQGQDAITFYTDKRVVISRW